VAARRAPRRLLFPLCSLSLTEKKKARKGTKGATDRRARGAERRGKQKKKQEGCGSLSLGQNGCPRWAGLHWEKERKEGGKG